MHQTPSVTIHFTTLFIFIFYNKNKFEGLEAFMGGLSLRFPVSRSTQASRDFMSVCFCRFQTLLMDSRLILLGEMAPLEISLRIKLETYQSGCGCVPHPPCFLCNKQMQLFSVFYLKQQPKYQKYATTRKENQCLLSPMSMYRSASDNIINPSGPDQSFLLHFFRVDFYFLG